MNIFLALEFNPHIQRKRSDFYYQANISRCCWQRKCVSKMNRKHASQHTPRSHFPFREPCFLVESRARADFTWLSDLLKPGAGILTIPSSPLLSFEFPSVSQQWPTLSARQC